MNAADTPQPAFKAGMAALIGRTNVGKSSLLNALVGRKVAIVTPKPQTTRDTLHGVVNRPEGQIVFVDTPGFFKTHASRLVDSLHLKVREALAGIDVVVHVVDPSRPLGAEDAMAQAALRLVTVPKVLCLNKSDLPERPFRGAWLNQTSGYAATFEVSAVTRGNVDALAKAIVQLLPAGAPLYPPDQVTNADRTFLIAEIIREKVYLLTGEEVPYRTSVEVDVVEERPDRAGKPMWVVKAEILAADDRYQRMLIGVGARKIKEIGTAARRELEVLLNRKVFLDLDVVVDKHLLQ